MRKRILEVLAVLVIFEIVLQISVFLYSQYYLVFARPGNIDTEAYRIICVGESTTWGQGARGNGYPEQLENILNEKFPDKKFQVFNLGVSAVTSSEIRKHFFKNIVDYRPHLAIILAGANGNGPRLFYSTKETNYHKKIIFSLLNKSKIVKLSTFLFHFLNAQLNKNVKILESIAGIYSLYQLHYYHKDYMNIIDHEFNLNDIVNTAYKNRVKILLCSYFNHPINDFLREFAVKRDIPFCDNETIYKQWKDEYGTTKDIIATSDTWHPNAKGYSLIAQNLFQSIIRYRLIEEYR